MHRPLAPPKSHFDPDDAIRLTDDDAASSRLSVSPLASAFKGTHHRTYGIDLLVDKFLRSCEATGKAAQILSLGAGTDSRFWRLSSQPDPPNINHYVEIDFATATGTKAHRISRSPKLHSAFSDPTSTPTNKPYRIEGGGTALRSHNYSLLPIDLRKLNALNELDEVLDSTLPILILAECVLCYMQPEEADRIFEWAGRFADRAIIVYEMVGLGDTFGQVMKRNLAARNLKLPGAVYETPGDMSARFTNPSLGSGRFDAVGAITLWDIRKFVIPEEELHRISQLEHLDEIEELQLVLNHYCIAHASSGAMLSNVKF